MATTINYTVRKTQRKDGTYAVNIRIIHNREMRRLPTSVYLTKGQLSRDLNTIKDVKSEEIVQTILNKFLPLGKSSVFKVE